METLSSPSIEPSEPKPRRSLAANRLIQLVLVGAILIVSALFVRQKLKPVDPDRSGIVASSDEFFESEVASESGPVLVKFGAEWCGPCKVLDMTLNAYSKTPGAVKVVLVDVDKQTEITSHYQVAQIPHSFLFLNGKVIGNRLGTMSLKDLKSWIDVSTPK